MSELAFFSDDARTKTKTLIGEIEQGTSAELVVTVRRRSGSYRATDYLVGAVTGLVVLALVLFLPREFAIETMPLDVAIAFGIGAGLTSLSPAARRLFTSKGLMREAVSTAARAAFFDQGISRTRGRSGVLVYVSMLERDVEVLPDLGVDVKALGESWTAAVARARAAVRASDLEGFLTALRDLGASLGAKLPRGDDDENELPDDVATE